MEEFFMSKNTNLEEEIIFFDAEIVEEGGEISVKFGSNKLALTAEKAEKAKEYIGKTVIMGIRPEDLYDDEESLY